MAVAIIQSAILDVFFSTSHLLTIRSVQSPFVADV